MTRQHAGRTAAGEPPVTVAGPGVPFVGRRIAGRISSARLVSREAEMEQLERILVAALDGSPATVLVTGEAGIGKTRLVEEFGRSARAKGVRVWAGSCPPMVNALLPYAPIVDILRAAIRDVGLSHVRSVAGGLAPRLGPLLPELGDPAGPRGTGAGPHRLHTELRYLVERLADEPTVVVIEDLHWADPSTQLLVGALASGRRERPAILLGTYRTDELHPAHPLRGFLAEVGRSGPHRVALGRLDRAGTAELVAGIVADEPDGGEPDAETVARLYARTGGNPFLVEELLAAAPNGTGLPGGLRDILLGRVRRLSPAAGRVLRAAAVAGRDIDHALLARVTGRSTGRRGGPLDAGVAEAVDHHVLIHRDDRYAFRHALVAEAVLADLLPGERRRLHRAFAEAIGAGLPPGGAEVALPAMRPTAGPAARSGPVGGSASVAARAEVAYHWRRARDPGRALVASVRAGLAAKAVLALPEAREQLRRALDLWWDAPRAHAQVELSLGDLYGHTAECAFHLGAVEEAVALGEDAIRAGDADGPVTAGRRHERLGTYLASTARPPAEAIAAFRRAVRLIPARLGEDRARALNGLALALMLDMRGDEAMTWVRRALTAARHAGARHQESRALATMGPLLVARGEARRAVAVLEEAVDIARGREDPEELHRCHTNLSDALRESGRFEEAAGVALDGVGLAERMGTAPNVQLYNAIDALWWLGRWDRVTELLASRPRDEDHPVQRAMLNIAAATLDTARGRYEAAHGVLAAELAEFGDGGCAELRCLLLLAAAELHLWRGDAAAATPLVERALRLFDGSGGGSAYARTLAVGARATAELAPGGGTALAALPELIRALARDDRRTPCAAAFSALAEAELSRAGTPDPELWDRVGAEWARLGGPHPLAYARWRQAEALLAVKGRRRLAARVLHEARADAARLRAAPLLNEIDALARRARLDLGAGAAHRARPSAPYGLTPREREVLALVERGHTNRQIARHLFISEKTVSIHMTRVLAKLGVPNRAAAAALAHRLGTADPAVHNGS